MTKTQIHIGGEYIAKVSGKLATVRIAADCPYGGWYAINTDTKREIRIRSAARLRRTADTDRLAAIRNLRAAGATFEDARAKVAQNEQAIRDAAWDIVQKHLGGSNG